jgi:mRNA-degrading endonuclease RelE of RelBE toxin-antitoxin system
MNFIQSERVKTALHTMSRDDRERVLIWFGHLKNWWDENTDAYVRSQSVKLDVQGQEVYVFRTSTDVRIFFTVDEATQTITVIDVATKDTILASGGALTGGT